MTKTDPITAFAVPAREKRAVQIANALEAEILKEDWPIGKSLGVEENLVSRFGVSRWIIREAIALMEHDGIVRVKRGPTGGLVVAEPAVSVLVHKIRNFLLFNGCTSTDILSARVVLDRIVFRSVSEYMCEASRQTIKAGLREADSEKGSVTMQTASDVNSAFVEAAQSPALTVFSTALLQTLLARGILRGLPDFQLDVLSPKLARIFELRIAQIRHVLDGEKSEAIALNDEARDAYAQIFIESEHAGISTSRKLRLSAIIGLFFEDRANRKSAKLTFLIQEHLIVNGLKSGDFIGTEAELMQMFKVGRGVMREAIRYLERDGFVKPGEGRGGGIYVCEPNGESIVRSAVLHLTYLQVPKAQILECAIDIEREIVGLACRQGRDVKAKKLALLDRISVSYLSDANKFPALTYLYYDTLCDIAGLTPLGLFLKILSRIVTFDQIPSSVEVGLRRDFSEKIAALSNAIRIGDESLGIQIVSDIRAAGVALPTRRRTPEELMQQFSL